MANTSRQSAVSDGQLVTELRSRVQSDFQSRHHAELEGMIADVGEPCWLSGPTSAALHGFDGFRLTTPHHLLVPRERNVRRVGVVVHRTEHIELLDRCVVRGLPATSAARTLIDLSAYTSVDVLTVALDGALRDGLISERFLHARIAALRTKGRHGVPRLLQAVEGGEITRGAHSWLERETLRLLEVTGMPRPSTQQVLGRRGDTLIRVDFRFPGTDVVVEVLGYRWHRTGAQMRADAERMNHLQTSGYVVLQFTYSDVVERPSYVVATIRAALAGKSVFCGSQ